MKANNRLTFPDAVAILIALLLLFAFIFTLVQADERGKGEVDSPWNYND